MEEIYKKYFQEEFNDDGSLKSIRVKYPQNFNFSYDILDEIARKYPNNLALVWCDDDGNEKRITFKEMSDMSNRVANFFINHGVKYGDFVLVILKRNFEYWYVVNALCKIGAVVIPATHMLSSLDLEYRINFAKVSTIIFTSQSGVKNRILDIVGLMKNEIKLFSVRGAVEDGVKNCVDIFSGIEKYSKNLNRINTNIDDPMLCYFTSGTTGNPKLVQHNFLYPLSHMITAKYWQKASFSKLHFTVSDTGWAKAAWGKMYGQWLVGATIFVYDYDKFIPYNILKVIEKYQISTFCAPPTVYRFLMKEGILGFNLSCLKSVTTAGEALNPEIIKQFYKMTGLEIMTGFGQTETAAVIFNDGKTKGKFGSLGKVSKIYDVILLDEEGKQVKLKEKGEICIKTKSCDSHSLGLFIGYYKDDIANKSAIKDGFYHTGDIAFCDEEGYYWYVGRKDDIIKSSGYRIGPFEVESVLIKHPAVLECGVVGVYDEVRGQILKANVVLTSNYKPSEALLKELQDFVKKNTAPYKYPRIIEFTKTLPKTISGKIKRNVLREKI